MNTSSNFKQMVVQKMIFAVDNNPAYSGFWEINSEICTKVLGITPVLFHITNEDSEFYNDKFGIVKKVKAIDGIDTGFQAQTIRTYATSYFQNEVCMLGDIDMLLFNKRYINESIQGMDENDFVIFSNDAYDNDRPECTYPWNGTRVPICYIAGKGSTFSKIVNTSMLFSDYCKYLLSLNLGWDTDEMHLGDMIVKSKGVKIHRLNRGYSSCFSASRRIEKRDFISGSDDIGKLNLKGKISINSYIDCHCARPLSRYFNEIHNLKVQIFKKYNLME